MDNQELYEQVTHAVIEESANNTLLPNNSNTNLQFSQPFNVDSPKPIDKMLIDKSSVTKVLKECSKAKKTPFPWAELLLGIATLLIGAFLSALISKFPYEIKFLSILFYTICPVVGIGCFTAYFLCRKLDGITLKSFAEKIEEQLKTDDETIEGESNEH